MELVIYIPGFECTNDNSLILKRIDAKVHGSWLILLYILRYELDEINQLSKNLNRDIKRWLIKNPFLREYWDQ